MKKRLPQRTVRAFTLLELLTVIAIIAILMALLIPGSEAAREQMRRTEARTAMQQIVAATNAYATEYGKLPTVAVDKSSPETDTIVGDTTLVPSVIYNNNTIFNTLRAIPNAPNTDNQLNPRRISYYPDARAVLNPALPKSGFQDNPTDSSSTTKGCLFDPWGSQYFIVLDTNYDNQIDVTSIYGDFSMPDHAPRYTVGAFSLGRDRQVGSPSLGITGVYRSGQNVSDDVLSWQ